MRCVVQRVSSCSVIVDNNVVGSIGPGLCALVGVSRTARPEDAAWLATKLARLRVFNDDEGKGWSRGLEHLPTHGLLLVSQFTVCHKPLTSGNKPDLHNAMNPRLAQPFFNAFVELCKIAVGPERVALGRFGEMMDVRIANDGPITIVIDTPVGPPALKQPLRVHFAAYQSAVAEAEAAAAAAAVAGEAASPTTTCSPMSPQSPSVFAQSETDAGAPAAKATADATAAADAGDEPPMDARPQP